MRRPVEPLTPPADRKPPAAPVQGRHIHLRAARSKSEKRLVAQLKKAFKGRERAFREIVMCNRAIDQAEADLRKAGMVQEPPQSAGGPKAEAVAP